LPCASIISKYTYINRGPKSHKYHNLNPSPNNRVGSKSRRQKLASQIWRPNHRKRDPESAATWHTLANIAVAHTTSSHATIAGMHVRLLLLVAAMVLLSVAGATDEDNKQYYVRRLKIRTKTTKAAKGDDSSMTSKSMKMKKEKTHRSGKMSRQRKSELYNKPAPAGQGDTEMPDDADDFDGTDDKPDDEVDGEADDEADDEADYEADDVPCSSSDPECDGNRARP